MPLYRPREVAQFLQSLGRSAKRTLSQNFLVDGNVVEKIVSLTKASPGETIIEIGSGPGVLTEAFLQRNVHVVAIELDSDFAKALPRLEKTGEGHLQVIEGDVLKVDLGTLTHSSSLVRLVSNLPYHLTKEILLYIATSCPHPFQATLMVQEEVARKLTQDAISSSLLSMTLALYGTFSYEGKVSKSCFFPSPTVDSALLLFRSHRPLFPEALELKKFLFLLTRAYQQRRKTVLSTVVPREKKEQFELWCEAQGILKTCRPDDLSLEQWIELFNALQ